MLNDACIMVRNLIILYNLYLLINLDRYINGVAEVIGCSCACMQFGVFWCERSMHVRSVMKQTVEMSVFRVSFMKEEPPGLKSILKFN